MATLIRNTNPNPVPVPLSRVHAGIQNYWTSFPNERKFPIAFWKIDKLLAASSSSEIAVRVTNSNSSNDVDVEWLSHDAAKEAAISAPTFNPSDYYFIMKKSELDEFKPTGNVNKYLLFARIGKTTNNTIFVFLNKSNIIDYNNQPGVGPNGGGGGVEIPQT